MAWGVVGTVANPGVALFLGVDGCPVGRGCVTWAVIVGGSHRSFHFRLRWGVLVPLVLQSFLVQRGENRWCGCGWPLGSAGWMPWIPRPPGGGTSGHRLESV